MKLHEYAFAIAFVIIVAVLVGAGPLYWATHTVLKDWHDPGTIIIILYALGGTVFVFRLISRTLTKPVVNFKRPRLKKSVQEA